MAFNRELTSQSILNEILDTYNHIKKCIERHKKDSNLSPIKGLGTTKSQKWKHFKVHCINIFHIANGDTHKLRFISMDILKRKK